MKANLFSALVAASLTSAPGPAGAAPIELGRVAWGRDVDAGFAAARRTGRPGLVLFQEIPGCATGKNFGSGPLSQRLLVDAIEFEFVPVVVYNNRPGAAAALQSPRSTSPRRRRRASTPISPPGTIRSAG